MAGNTFGQAFRITTAGEAHGPGYVVIIDGCPPGMPLGVEDLRPDLARRRPAQSAIVSQRNEADEPEILSGVFEGQTTGTSIAILIRNLDPRSGDYSEIKEKLSTRPCRLHLRCEVRLSRLPRRWAVERSRNDGSRGRGRYRQEAHLCRVRWSCRGLRSSGG